MVDRHAEWSCKDADFVFVVCYLLFVWVIEQIRFALGVFCFAHHIDQEKDLCLINHV